jgi:hypothetical protein
MCIHYWIVTTLIGKSQQNQWRTKTSNLNTQRGKVILLKLI